MGKGGSSLQPLRTSFSPFIFLLSASPPSPPILRRSLRRVRSSRAPDFLQFFVSRASITFGKYCQEKSDSSSLLHRPSGFRDGYRAKNHVKVERQPRVLFCHFVTRHVYLTNMLCLFTQHLGLLTKAPSNFSCGFAQLTANCPIRPSGRLLTIIVPLISRQPLCIEDPCWARIPRWLGFLPFFFRRNIRKGFKAAPTLLISLVLTGSTVPILPNELFSIEGRCLCYCNFQASSFPNVPFLRYPLYSYVAPLSLNYQVN